MIAEGLKFPICQKVQQITIMIKYCNHLREIQIRLINNNNNKKNSSSSCDVTSALVVNNLSG